MNIVKGLGLIGLAAFALAVIAACGGDDGDDAFELPPPGEYRFEVTGTMEVEFPAEGVSAAPIALQQTETGQVSGELTSIVVGNTLTIPELGFTVTFGDTEITFGETFPEAMGSIGPDGTTWSLNLVAMPPSGETLTGQDPFLLESDSNPFSDNNPPFVFNPPPDFDGIPFNDSSGNPGLVIDDYELNLALFQGPTVGSDLSEEDFYATEEAELAAIELAALEDEEGLCLDCGEPFVDEEGDDTFCGTDEPSNNPTVDITRVNFSETADGFWMEIVTAASPAPAFENYVSQSTEGTLGDQRAITEVHNKVRRIGLLDPDGGDFAPLLPGSAQYVTIGDESVSFRFAPEANVPGTPWSVETFSLENDGDRVSCDTAEGVLP